MLQAWFLQSKRFRTSNHQMLSSCDTQILDHGHQRIDALKDLPYLILGTLSNHPTDPLVLSDDVSWVR